MNQHLTASLLDLLHEIQDREIRLMIGGGFGLHLKRHHLHDQGERLLLERLPPQRSTKDIDIFLQTEVLVDLQRTREVADALRRLGYTSVEEAKFLQWQREINVGGVAHQVRIDVLVGPLGDARKELYVKNPRVRPKGNIQFHAHAVEEAVGLDDNPLCIHLTGTRSNGEPCSGTVYVPQAFPYLMMKLHAFEDRLEKGEQAKQQQHALDLYAVVGTMTEEEYERARELRVAHRENQHVARASAIVRERFSSRTAPGILRLREHPLSRDDFQLEEFIEVLREVFADS